MLDGSVLVLNSLGHPEPRCPGVRPPLQGGLRGRPGFRTYDWENWCDIPSSQDEFIATPSIRVKVPRVVLSASSTASRARRSAARKNIYFRDRAGASIAGRVRDTRAEPRPSSRSRAEEDDLGQRRLLLLRLQPPEGEPSPRRVGMRLVRARQAQVAPAPAPRLAHGTHGLEELPRHGYWNIELDGRAAPVREGPRDRGAEVMNVGASATRSECRSACRGSREQVRIKRRTVDFGTTRTCSQSDEIPGRALNDRAATRRGLIRRPGRDPRAPGDPRGQRRVRGRAADDSSRLIAALVSDCRCVAPPRRSSPADRSPVLRASRRDGRAPLPGR